MDEKKCRELIEDMSNGKNHAFHVLFVEMSKSVFSYAYSIVQNWSIAEDITQDVFVHIKLNSAKFKKKSSANGWIFTLTKNIALNTLKKRRHEIEVGNEFFESIPIHTNIEDLIVIKNAINQLEKTNREIVILHLVAGVSQKEIAKLLFISQSAVSWKYRVSMKKLNCILKGRENND